MWSQLQTGCTTVLCLTGKVKFDLYKSQLNERSHDDQSVQNGGTGSSLTIKIMSVPQTRLTSTWRPDAHMDAILEPKPPQISSTVLQYSIFSCI